MTTINQLNAADSVTTSDQFVIWQNSNGDSRKVSATKVAEFVQDQITATDDKNTQYAAPTTGATVSVDDTGDGIWLILTPAGTLSTLEIEYPAEASTVDKQEILINSTQAVTTLTHDGNGSSVVGGPSSLSANGYFRMRYDAVLSTWYRVG